MYLSYYKLSKKPFQISTDPSFFWLGEKHKEALSLLKYGVMDDKGFLLLTGDVGTGKTTLINSFVNSLDDDVIISRISDPGMTQLDFIHYLAKMFKIETKFETKSEFLILFTDFLEQADRDNKKVLLIIDEAQHLTDETLEEIRLLSNIEKQYKKLLNIFLVGQSEFNETLENYKNRALRQRLTLNYTLCPLEAEETKACIEYRLHVAGAEREIFTPKAIDAVHTISCGFPRVINIICDHALRLGCQEDQKNISESIINQCSKTLHAAHLHKSQQYDGDFKSDNEWLEESEVPPLSEEAISRVSQPLPDFIVENEDETKEKPRRYGVIAPLFLVGLFVSMFFLLKDDTRVLFLDFLTNVKKNPIAVTEKTDSISTDFQETYQQTDALVSFETAPATVTPVTTPIVITKEKAKQSFDVPSQAAVYEENQPDTDQQVTVAKAKTTSNSQVNQVIKQPAESETGVLNEISFEESDDVDAEMVQQDSVISDLPQTDVEEAQEEISAEPFSAEQSQPSVTQATESTETKIADYTKSVQQDPVVSDLPQTEMEEPQEEISPEPISTAQSHPSITQATESTETKIVAYAENMQQISVVSDLSQIEVEEPQEEISPESISSTQSQPSVTQGLSDNEKKSGDDLKLLLTQPDSSSPDPVIEPPSTMENETADVDIEIKDNVLPPVSINETDLTDPLLHDNQEAQINDSEVISEPPISHVNQTQDLVENAVYNTPQSLPQSLPQLEPQPIPQAVGPATIQRDVESAAPSSNVQESVKTNDDPGAVIDWLLKSKQN